MELNQSPTTGEQELSKARRLLQSVYNLNFKGRKNHPDWKKHSNGFAHITYFPNGADLEIFGTVYQIKWEIWREHDEQLINFSIPITKHIHLLENLIEVTKNYLASTE